MCHLAVPEDKARSPFTGFTREHWLAITGKIIAGFMPYMDRQTGMFQFVGNPRETALHRQLVNPGGILEAFDRTSMAVAAYLAATGQTQIEGLSDDIAACYRVGIGELLNCGDKYSRRKQRRNYIGAGMTLAMLLAPEHLLDPLKAGTKDKLRADLAAGVERTHRDTNTLLFSMMPAAVLERIGGDYNRALLDDHFETILSMYAGDGWFIDGWNRGFDHYNFWGFQLYLHALVHFDEKWRRRYSERIGEITARHEKTLPYYFGADGGPIPKGRSLNYRFAAVAGMGYAQLSGLSTLDPGLARRISSGCLRYFWDHGCLSEQGLLEPGFRASNSVVGEDYTDYGAPYWSATGLVPLALPPEHPFWTSPEKPLPADSPGVKRCLVKGARMLLKVDGDRKEARMLTVGEPFYHRKVWQAGSKYYQHAYSSTVGYALAGDLGPELAGGRTGISADGKQWSYRTWPQVVHLNEYRAGSRWDAWPGQLGLTGTVWTESLFLDQGEIHVFWHTADTPRYLTIGGYAVRLEHDEPAEARMDERQAVLQSRNNWSVLKIINKVNGVMHNREIKPRPGFLHAHIFEGWAAFPQWTTTDPVASKTKIAVFVDAALHSQDGQVNIPEIQLKTDAPRMVFTVENKEYSV